MPELLAGVGSIHDAVVYGAGRLAAAGSFTPRLDAEVLLAFVLGVDRSRLVIDAGSALPGGAVVRYAGLLRRREACEPVAYLVGAREFRRITLAVDRRVLIPRPETELLVEVGLSVRPGGRVADVGTGSGAVALALKDERPDLDVVGTDLSPEAVEVARSNAARLGLDAVFVVGDLLSGVGGRSAGEAGGSFDAVLANLPYVAAGEALPPEISSFEPASALFAGPDGLDVIRRLVATADSVPLLALEVGAGQAPAVESLLASAGFARVERLRDLAGHERVVVGRR